MARVDTDYWIIAEQSDQTEIDQGYSHRVDPVTLSIMIITDVGSEKLSVARQSTGLFVAQRVV